MIQELLHVLNYILRVYNNNDKVYIIEDFFVCTILSFKMYKAVFLLFEITNFICFSRLKALLQITLKINV
jgi:hypothetical protein